MSYNPDELDFRANESINFKELYAYLLLTRDRLKIVKPYFV